MGNSEVDCICSRCRKKFRYDDAVVVKRKLYNSEIEERKCPYCGSKSFSPLKEIHYLAQMASKHTHNGNK